MANNTKKYKVQTRFENPPAVAAHSGKQYRWIDASEHQTKAEANKARRDDQRVIKICTRSEFASLVDTGAYPGRRFNKITEGVN